MRAVLVGVAATVGLFVVSWVVLAEKESLDGRNVVSVLVAPDFRLVSPATKEKASYNHNSPYCRVPFVPYEPAPTRLGCVKWRRPEAANSGAPLSGWGDYWQGSEKTIITPARPDIYGGVSRSRALESMKTDFGNLIYGLIIPIGWILMILVGTATGYRYFRRISDSVER